MTKEEIEKFFEDYLKVKQLALERVCNYHNVDIEKCSTDCYRDGFDIEYFDTYYNTITTVHISIKDLCMTDEEWQIFCQWQKHIINPK